MLQLFIPASLVKALSLIAVTYFLVCGGSYGTEALARCAAQTQLHTHTPPTHHQLLTRSSIPPMYGLLGILIIPWFWSFPIALMTAELATSMPTSKVLSSLRVRAW